MWSVNDEIRSRHSVSKFNEKKNGRLEDTPSVNVEERETKRVTAAEKKH